MNNKKESFPWSFIIIGALICCLLTCARVVTSDIDNQALIVFIVVIASLLIGFIPMLIAYKRQPKHRHGIYIMSVVAMCVASPLISLVAILWACFDKKIKR